MKTNKKTGIIRLYNPGMVRVLLQDLLTNAVKSSLFKCADHQVPQKSGSTVETLCPRLQAHSRSKQVFGQKGGTTEHVTDFSFTKEKLEQALLVPTWLNCPKMYEISRLTPRLPKIFGFFGNKEE